MKTLITTVGTSLFTNYMKPDERDKIKDYRDIGDALKGIEDSPASDYAEVKDDAEAIAKIITSRWFCVDGQPNVEASAEIKSVLKISANLKENCEVYLLATDTVTSRLAAELIKQWFEDKNCYQGEYAIKVIFNPDRHIIPGLQIKDKKAFQNNGLVELLNRFYSIAGNNYANTILNITGGFKALIPYLTILAQVNQVKIQYIFEDTDTLIEIPFLPLKIDDELFERWAVQFAQLESDFLKRGENYTFWQEAQSCLEVNGDEIMLNSLGSALWNKYKARFFTFLAPDDVWQEIQTQQDILRILQNKFHDEAARENKTETKQVHRVFDDGKNNNRIYYFTHDGNVYIYKTFESESAAKKFIDSDLDKDAVIRASQPRHLLISQQET
jgi:putative CRISPR-associated protein (TIGR02619 family)